MISTFIVETQYNCMPDQKFMKMHRRLRDAPNVIVIDAKFEDVPVVYVSPQVKISPYELKALNTFLRCVNCGDGVFEFTKFYDFETKDSQRNEKLSLGRIAYRSIGKALSGSSTIEGFVVALPLSSIYEDIETNQIRGSLDPTKNEDPYVSLHDMLRKYPHLRDQTRRDH
jgi:hypothetical protein